MAAILDLVSRKVVILISILLYMMTPSTYLQINNTLIVICELQNKIIHNYTFWRPYWIFGVRKSSKWVHIYTTVFVDPRNVLIDTKFTVIDTIQVKL